MWINGWCGTRDGKMGMGWTGFWENGIDNNDENANMDLLLLTVCL
jgi:hypothetical protein